MKGKQINVLMSDFFLNDRYYIQRYQRSSSAPHNVCSKSVAVYQNVPQAAEELLGYIMKTLM